MKYVTYENRTTRRVTIHIEGCGQLRKNGGTHKYGQGAYEDHETFADADNYAKITGLTIKHCSFCAPQGRA